MKYAISLVNATPDSIAEPVYQIKHILNTTDVDGNSVEVFDDNQTEVTTVADLENQRDELQKQIDRLQDQIAEVDAKLTAISKL